MANSAFQTAFRQEIVNGFDKTVSLLYDTVTTEYLEKGGSAVFLVSDSAAKIAQTRGISGEIPADSLDLTQNTATLEPWHSLVRVNDFNLFASQGDLKRPMQRNVMAAINRKIDDTITDILTTGTVDTGAAVTADMALITKAKGILGLAKVPSDGNITLIGTPAMTAYLMRMPEFTSADYVDGRPVVDGGPAWGDMRKVYKWLGMTYIEDPLLPGVGTAAEECYMYHSAAIGFAVNRSNMEYDMDFDREQRYSWANGCIFMGSTLLQNSGIVVINHDGSAIVGS